MFRTIRQYLRTISLLPSTLEQSIGNPIQQDRLPDTSGVELEFPVISGSLPENRWQTLWQILIAVLFCLAIAIVANFNVLYAIEFVLGFIASVALLVFSITLIGFPAGWRHWLFYLIGLPVLMLAMTTLREPMLVTLVACWCAAVMANQFASHLFHLQTSSIMDRARALQLRNLWKNRWHWHTAKGLELSSLTLLILIIFPCVLWWSMSRPPTGEPWENFPALATGAALVCLVPLVVELLAGFFYVRPWIRFRDMWAAFRPAVVQWYTYNRHDLNVAGAYRSPAGSCRRRRRLTFWLMIMFAACLGQFFSFGLGHSRSRYYQEGHPSRSIWEKASDIYPFGWSDAPPVETIRGQSPDRERASVLGSSPILLAGEPAPKTTPSKLEPYQERMLKRMAPAEREAYLERIRKQIPHDDGGSKAQPAAAPSPKGGRTESLEAGDDRVAVSSVKSVLGIFAIGVIVASYPLLTVLLTLAYVGGYCFAASARVAGYFRPQADIQPQDVLSADRWEALVSRVQASRDKHEKSSLLLGVNASDNTPILVPLKVFEEHAHLIGDSGSGKTSLGISLILSQMARFPETSVVVIDLKGDDLALFSGTRVDSEKAGKSFRWFTNELGRSTYAFNPLRQAFFSGLSLYQKTDVITTALGLQYGTDYGRGYFSDANAELLFHALKVRPDIDSFQELEQVLGDRYALRGVSNQVLKDGSHIRTIVSRLAATEALNVTPRNQVAEEVQQQQIEFRDVFRTPQVVYLHLPSSLGTTSSAEIARIALYSLLGSARTVPDAERKQVFVFIDEFQRIVSGNLELILQTARSMKVGLILANQSMYDLKRQGIDLMPAVRANTRYKQIFAASNVEDQQELIALSGQTLLHQRSWQESLSFLHGGQTSVSYNESLLPRLGVNDILLATDHPLQSIVQIRRGDGYAQYGGFPFVMRSTHHIGVDEFRARKNASWPEPNEATLVPSLTAPTEDASAVPSGKHKPIIEGKASLESGEEAQADPLQDLWNAQVSKRKKPPKP